MQTVEMKAKLEEKIKALEEKRVLLEVKTLIDKIPEDLLEELSKPFLP